MTSLFQFIRSLGSDRGVFVRNAVPSHVNSILDIGCAFGWDLDALSDRADRLVGVDLDEEALAQAHAQYPHLTFLSCSATELPFEDDAFDVVILSEVIEHVGEANKQPVVDEAYRVLKPGGRFIFTAPFAGATAWADPLDFKRRFPSAYRLYLKASGYEPKTAMDIGHKHVSLPEIETLFGGRFEMETLQFSGFFAPFITWVLTAGERTGVFGEPLVKRINRFRAWEDGVPYPQPLAYNVRLVARKSAGDRVPF